MRSISVFVIVIAILFSACNTEKKHKFYGEPHIVETYKDSLKKVERKYIKKDSSSWQTSVYYRNGQLEIQGLSINGEREGEWSAWSKDGILLTKGNYHKGIDHGLKTVYYKNGNKRYQGMFEDGERVGVWRFWHKNGEFAKEIKY